jgi:hypothetical protein
MTASGSRPAYQGPQPEGLLYGLQRPKLARSNIRSSPVSRSAETSARFYPIILRFSAGDAQSIARSDLRWRRDLLLDHQLQYRHHRLMVEEEPEPAPEIQFVPAPVTGSI